MTSVIDTERDSKMKRPNVCHHYDVPVTSLVKFINSPEWRQN